MPYIGNKQTIAFETSYTKEDAEALFRIPTGIIAMWYGSIATIPEGWALCDGNQGTPNLTNRFVIGAGGSYGVDSIGGSADAVVVSHSHTASSGTAGNHNHSGSTTTNGNHRHHSGHFIDSNPNESAAYGWYGYDSGVSNTTNNRASYSTRGGYVVGMAWSDYQGNHNHSLSINSNGNHSHSVTVNSNGEDGAGKNLPPYYALAYIMKL